MKVTKAEQYFLDRIREGSEQAWSEFVDRYRGRLLSFARAKLAQGADAEDVLQETFVAFIQSLHNFRADCDLETYLFSLLRRKIVDNYRSKRSRHVCLIQDTYDSSAGERSSDFFAGIAGPAKTASWYARADEQHDLQQSALAEALSKFVDGLKSELKFRDLELTELLFYSQLPNKDVAKAMDLNEKAVALFKHRALKRIREHVARCKVAIDPSCSDFEGLLTDVWESHRLSCLKRSTIGAFLLGTLDADWVQYADFHLNVLGCRFCRANMEDLNTQSTAKQQQRLHARIMESTLGFLHKPG